MASPNARTSRAMTADQIIAFADALRQHARASGRDLNAANLFVHTVLARTIKYDDAPIAGPHEAHIRAPHSGHHPANG